MQDFKEGRRGYGAATWGRARTVDDDDDDDNRRGRRGRAQCRIEEGDEQEVDDREEAGDVCLMRPKARKERVGTGEG